MSASPRTIVAAFVSGILFCCTHVVAQSAKPPVRAPTVVPPQATPNMSTLPQSAKPANGTSMGMVMIDLTNRKQVEAICEGAPCPTDCAAKFRAALFSSPQLLRDAISKLGFSPNKEGKADTAELVDQVIRRLNQPEGPIDTVYGRISGLRKEFDSLAKQVGEMERRPVTPGSSMPVSPPSDIADLRQSLGHALRDLHGLREGGLSKDEAAKVRDLLDGVGDLKKRLDQLDDLGKRVAELEKKPGGPAPVFKVGDPSRAWHFVLGLQANALMTPAYNSGKWAVPEVLARGGLLLRVHRRLELEFSGNVGWGYHDENVLVGGGGFALNIHLKPDAVVLILGGEGKTRSVPGWDGADGVKENAGLAVAGFRFLPGDGWVYFDLIGMVGGIHTSYRQADGTRVYGAHGAVGGIGLGGGFRF